jgi:hypothetical protein
MRLKPDQDPTPMIDGIKAAERVGSGLIRSLMMRDQADPASLYSLVVFESEEAARVRERDPERAEQLEPIRSMMADMLEGAPEFTDLEIVDEWTGA